jgi:hypothetical protein
MFISVNVTSSETLFQNLYRIQRPPVVSVPAPVPESPKPKGSEKNPKGSEDEGKIHQNAKPRYATSNLLLL